MRKKRNLLLILGVIAAFYSCKDEVQIDTPLITSYEANDEAFMGDSIPLSITATGDYPLNSIKVTFFQNNQQISESIIPTKDPGTFNKKIQIPFVKDIPDGSAEIQLMVKNKNFNYSTVLIPIQVTRPKFPYLTLRTKDYGDYRMEPTGTPYEYAVTDDFPNSELKAVIIAPAYGTNGNEIIFGGGTIVVNAAADDYIPFQKVGTTHFTVKFNTLTFEGEPFLKPAINDQEFPEYAGNTASIDLNLTQNQTIKFDGILDIASWWKNPAFLDNNGDGTYKFRAIDGKYRFTADNNLKYFKIEPLNNDGELLEFDLTTRTGTIWVNGGRGAVGGPTNGIGFPSYASNPSNWDPTNNVAMAPIGNGKYEIILQSATTIFESNVSGGPSAGIAFYPYSRSFDDKTPFILAQTVYGGSFDLNPLVHGTEAPYPYNSLTARFEKRNKTADPNVGDVITTISNRQLNPGFFFSIILDTNYSPFEVIVNRKIY